LTRTPEDDRLALLQVFSSQQVQYASFVLTFAVATFAEITLLPYFSAAVVWAAVIASVVGGILCLEGYLELTHLSDLFVEEAAKVQSGPNQLKLIKSWYQNRMAETSTIGKIARFRSHHDWIRPVILCPVIFVALAILFAVSGTGGVIATISSTSTEVGAPALSFTPDVVQAIAAALTLVVAVGAYSVAKTATKVQQDQARYQGTQTDYTVKQFELNSMIQVHLLVADENARDARAKIYEQNRVYPKLNSKRR
jgi:hypothetical protein